MKVSSRSADIDQYGSPGHGRESLLRQALLETEIHDLGRWKHAASIGSGDFADSLLVHQIIEVRKLIRSLAGDHTIILSTHILSEVSQTCQRVLIIHQGHITAEGTPAELTARLRGSEQVILQVARPTKDTANRLHQLEGVTDVQELEEGQYQITCARGPDRRPAISTLAVQQGWDLLEIRPGGMTLEEIFILLTGQ